MNFENTAQQALGFALATLKSMNAKFKIALPDGTEYSIDNNGTITKRKTTKRIAYKKMYINRLKALEPGHDLTFDVPENVDVEGLRSSISSSCNVIFGSKKFSTKIVNNKILVWRFKTVEMGEQSFA